MMCTSSSPTRRCAPSTHSSLNAAGHCAAPVPRTTRDVERGGWLHPPLRRRGPSNQGQDGWGGNRDLAGDHLAGKGRVRAEDGVVERGPIRVEENGEYEGIP